VLEAVARDDSSSFLPLGGRGQILDTGCIKLRRPYSCDTPRQSYILLYVANYF